MQKSRMLLCKSKVSSIAVAYVSTCSVFIAEFLPIFTLLRESPL